MLSLRPRLALFLLFLTVSTLGLPINNGKTPKSLEEIKPKKLVDQSTISSKCNKIGMWPWYNRYEITATKWPLSEEEVKKAVKSAGLMTGWMYRPWGTDLTVIQFNLDLITKPERLEGILNKALGVDDKDSPNAVKCKPSGRDTRP